MTSRTSSSWGASSPPIVGVIGLAVVYAIAVELRIGAFWSGVAVLILAISALMIRYATTVRADMLQILFLLLILWIMARSLSRPTATSFVLAGACLGFAVTSKYPGLVGVVPIVAAATTLVLERRLTARKAFLWLAMAAIASVVTAALAGPYLFINLQGALEALTVEARPEHLGATSNGFVWALWSYVTEALPEALGPVGTVLGVVGAVVMLGDRRARLVGLTFWAYLVCIALLSLWWERWVLPLVPMAALGIAYLVASIEAKSRARLAGRAEGRRLIAARLAVAALILLPLVVPTIDLVRGRATNDDTRVVAERVGRSQRPPGSDPVDRDLHAEPPIRPIRPADRTRWRAGQVAGLPQPASTGRLLWFAGRPLVRRRWRPARGHLRARGRLHPHQRQLHRPL